MPPGRRIGTFYYGSCVLTKPQQQQKARTTYDNILRLVKEPDVCDPIRFLREREIVHFQRFGEALRGLQERLDSRNFYAFNPSFDQAAAPQGPGRLYETGKRIKNQKSHEAETSEIRMDG